MLNEKNLIPRLINFLIINVEKANTEGMKKIDIFLNSLPDIDLIQETISKRLYSELDLVPIKLILDIYIFYFRNNDIVINEVKFIN